MKLRIITVGKISKWSKAALEHYTKLLKRFVRLEHIILSSGGDLNRENHEVIKEREAKKILEKTRGYVVCLDKEGKAFDSKEFAKFVESIRSRDVTVVIGGPLGLHDKVKRKCDILLSLSNMTLSHEVALVVFLEQLFRGFKIIHGQRYDY